jgi:hypothetical protein
MIEELFKVADALKDANISTYDWHPSLSALPSAANKPCIRVWLLQDGHVNDVEMLPEGLDKKLWKYEPNNGFALPGFNYSPPNLARIFGDVRASLEECCRDQLEDDETLARFFSAVKAIDIEFFKDEFQERVRSSFDEVTSAKLLKNGAKPSIFLDIKDYCTYPVSSLETMKRLNELLWSSYTPQYMGSVDAYNPEEKGISDLYPQVSLPLLGSVKLRSLVKAIPAQKRYDRCESVTFPTSLETRKRVKAALEWLAPRTGEHDGETYGIAGDKELLFAYPRVLLKAKIPITKMFGAQPDEKLKEDHFERLSESVIEQLKGLGNSVADAELEIFSLRKMDKARTKVVYYHNVTVSRLEAASKVWHEGCRNIPSLDIKDWSENKDEKTGKSYPVHVVGKTVFPVKLHQFINMVWKRDGKQAGKVKIFQPTDGLRLLLDEPCRQLADHINKRLMQHTQGYFLTLCRSTGRREIAKLPDKVYYPGILGLLLFKLGKRKEEYMKDSAIQLGRFLRVADEIHRLYCEVVRKNDLPPELCGSSMLVSMMESPGMTLNQLALRSAPYVKWAKAYHDDKVVRTIDGTEIKIIVLIKSWLKRWSEIADPLLEKGWPKRLSAEERAQVFLGYLASFPKNENQ